MARPPGGESGGGGGSKSPEGEQGSEFPGAISDSSVASAAGDASEERRPRSEKGVSAHEQVIRLRKQMQRERKEMLACMRPLAAMEKQRPWTTPECRSRSVGTFTRASTPGLPDFDRATALGAEKPEAILPDATGTEEPEERLDGSRRVIPKGSTESVLAKVNRAHKGLVRKEVWRQKFDFLYKQVEEEVMSNQNDRNASHSSTAMPGNATSTARLGSNAVAAFSSAAMLLHRDRPAVSRAPSNSSETRGEGSSRPSSRPSSASHVRLGRPRSCSGMSSATATTSFLRAGELSSIPGESQEFEVGDEPSRIAEAWGAQCAAPAKGGWCKTRSGIRQLPRRRQSSKSRGCRNSMEQHPSSTRLPSPASRGVVPAYQMPRLLSGSSSLPLLAAERRERELCGIKDEYYGGNELFMHEDILYCSNPNLFPLRPSHDKPFPLRSIVAFHGADAADRGIGVA